MNLIQELLPIQYPLDNYQRYSNFEYACHPVKRMYVP